MNRPNWMDPRPATAWRTGVVVLAVVMIVAILSGCATTTSRGTNYIPVVDLAGKNTAQWHKDLYDCQVLSEQRGNTAGSAAAGAVAAALLGAILAPSGYRNNVAGRAALIGAAGGAGQAVETQETIIKRCLTHRGYSVLN